MSIFEIPHNYFPLHCRDQKAEVGEGEVGKRRPIFSDSSWMARSFFAASFWRIWLLIRRKYFFSPW